MEDFDKKTVLSKDVIPIAKFDFNTYIPSPDKEGFWTNPERDRIIKLSRPRPFWATHIIWFNK